MGFFFQLTLSKTALLGARDCRCEMQKVEDEIFNEKNAHLSGRK